MHLILHIGTEKTGTTSIQQFLKKNRDKLYQNRVYVPLSPMVNNGNHRWIPAIANDVDFVDGFILGQQFKSEEDKKEKISWHKSQFLSECQDAAKRCDTLVLTSEHFQSRLRKEEEITRLRDFLGEVFDEVRIIIYLRDPLKTAISLLSTAIKSGGAQVSLPAPNEPSFEHVCNHGSTVRKWEKCFPDAEMVVRRFEKDLLIGGDVVIDFCCQVIDDFHREDYEYSAAFNETLSLTGMALLRKLNIQFPRLIARRNNPLRGRISKFVMDNTRDGTRFLPCREEFEVYRNHFFESCESVRTRYFPSEKILFKQHDEFANEKIYLADIEIKSEIYERLIAELWKQKRKIELRSKQ
jgi:hypothetical protein